MQKLYVILRGEFALYYNRSENRVHVVAPDIADHDYRISNWSTIGQSQNVRGIELDLKGAMDGGKDPAGQRELFLNVGAPRLETTRPYGMHVTMPRPSSMFAGLSESTDTVSILAEGKQFTGHIPASPAVIAVLVFDPLGATAPFLISKGGVTYEGDLLPNGDRAIHLVASGTWPESSAHARHAFTSAAALLGVASNIEWTSVDPPIFSAPDLATGLDWLEVNAPWGQILNPDGTYRTREQVEGLLNDTVYLASLFADGKGSGNCGPIVEDCPTCS